VELEAAARITEAARAYVLEGASERRQLRAQGAATEPLEAGMKTAAEDGEAVLELKPVDARELQLQQCVLARIGMNGMDLLGAHQRMASTSQPALVMTSIRSVGWMSSTGRSTAGPYQQVL
jgi:hypothetical protein